jgi:hypothetical protein
MNPVFITQNGTGASTPIIPDTKQNPFNIGIGVNIANGTAFWAVEHCFDFTTVMSPTWGGTTGVTWFVNSGLSGGTTAGQGTTSAPLNGNYAFAVAAIRLNVYSSGNTGQVTMNLIQSVNSP